MAVMNTLSTEDLHALRRYALALTRSADSAEDLVQETLARAMQGAASWDPRRDLRKWLFGILRNTHLSRRRREVLEAAVADGLAALGEAAAPPQQPDRIYLNQTLAAVLKLPEGQREVLALIVVEGLSYKDAAEVLGVPVGTVMSRLGWARAFLRAASGRSEDGRTPSEAAGGGKLVRFTR